AFGSSAFSGLLPAGAFAMGRADVGRPAPPRFTEHARHPVHCRSRSYPASARGRSKEYRDRFLSLLSPPVPPVGIPFFLHSWLASDVLSRSTERAWRGPVHLCR